MMVMPRLRRWRRFVLAGALAGCALPFSHAHAQDATPQTPPQQRGQADIEVTGQRQPPAEAPRSALCEQLAKDSRFQAVLSAAAAAGVMGPQVLVPTRLPRNPDWDAAPLSPPGSPLPELDRRRFGQSTVDYGVAQPGFDFQDPNIEADPSSSTATGRDQAVALCRAGYEPGTGFSVPARAGLPRSMGGSSSTFTGPVGGQAGRSDLVRNDTTLPMAFALFDEGRYQEAEHWFRQAYDRLPLRDGGEEAALFIGKINLLAPGDWADRAAGIEWLKKAAGFRYNPAIDMPQFDPLQPARNTAVGEAAIILGNLYRVGMEGVPPDMEEARRWYDRALDVGHLPAAQVLGDLTFNGQGTERDVRRAVRYYRRAAEFGLPSAQYALGQILEFGDDGVAQDVPEALRWYREAARASHPDALFALAVAYDRGTVVAADRTMALGFYKEAAVQGHAGAMAALGTYFYEGDGVARDLAAARGWFAQAAERGDPDGMVNLAVMSLKGEGGSSDRIAAWQWLDRAVRLRHDRAPQVLAAVEAQMTIEERQSASMQ